MPLLSTQGQSQVDSPSRGSSRMNSTHQDRSRCRKESHPIPDLDNVVVINPTVLSQARLLEKEVMVFSSRKASQLSQLTACQFALLDVPVVPIDPNRYWAARRFRSSHFVPSLPTPG
jgi:hypothetical protein